MEVLFFTSSGAMEPFFNFLHTDEQKKKNMFLPKFQAIPLVAVTHQDMMHRQAKKTAS